MLLKHLYVMSLEYPGPGCCVWFSAKGLEDLDSYIRGFLSANILSGMSDGEDDKFFNWLYARGQFPTKGWCALILESYEDGEKAYLKFFELLYKYLLETRPEWFISFNKEPQPSPLFNAMGKRRSDDIRNQQHIDILEIT